MNRWFRVGSSLRHGCAFYRNDKLTVYFSRTPAQGAHSQKSPARYAAWRLKGNERVGIRIYSLGQLVRQNDTQWLDLQNISSYFSLMRQDLAEKNRSGILSVGEYLREIAFINELQREVAGYRFKMPENLKILALA